jgi:hypothetical protein
MRKPHHHSTFVFEATYDNGIRCSFSEDRCRAHQAYRHCFAKPLRHHEHDSSDAARKTGSAARRDDRKNPSGTGAPNGGDFQTWHFVVVKDMAVKKAVQVIYKKAFDEIIGARYASLELPPGYLSYAILPIG